MSNDKVSVIIPVYKVEKFIRKCLESIVKQTYDNIEVIIVDDGTPDNSGKICDEYAAKYDFVYVYHKQNGGLSSARNRGIEKATGKWILFVDSDDWCDEQYIQKMMEMDKSDVDVIVSSTITEIKKDKYVERYPLLAPGIFDDSTILQVMQAKCFSTINVEKCKSVFAKNSNICAPWNKLYKTEIIRKYKLFFDEKSKVHEDYIFNLSYFGHVKKMSYVDARGYYYRYNTVSLTRAYNVNRVENIKYYMDFIYDYCKKYPDNPYLLEAMKLNALDESLVLTKHFFNPARTLKNKENREVFNDFLRHPMVVYSFNNLKLGQLHDFKHKIGFLMYKYKMYVLLWVIYSAKGALTKWV